MTIPAGYPAAPAPRKMSVASLLSFIFGILGCIAFLAGVIAIVFGIFGFIATANPLKSGRWMAVVGMILGVISIVCWIAFGGLAYAAFLGGSSVYHEIVAPAHTAHDFMQRVSNGDAGGARALSDMSQADFDRISNDIHATGTFVDSTFSGVNMASTNGNATAEITGTATFEQAGVSTTHKVTASLHKIGANWRLQDLTIAGP